MHPHRMRILQPPRRAAICHQRWQTMHNRGWSVSVTCGNTGASHLFGFEDVEHYCTSSRHRMVGRHFPQAAPLKGLASGYAWLSALGASSWPIGRMPLHVRGHHTTEKFWLQSSPKFCLPECRLISDAYTKPQPATTSPINNKAEPIAGSAFVSFMPKAQCCAIL